MIDASSFHTVSKDGGHQAYSSNWGQHFAVNQSHRLGSERTLQTVLILLPFLQYDTRRPPLFALSGQETWGCGATKSG